MTKTNIRISFENTRATISSTHRRTHDREKSARLPANANGLRTAATITSSFRTVRASHTMTTAARANSEIRIRAAGFDVEAEIDPAAKMLLPICCIESPVVTCSTPAEMASTA